MDAVREPDPRLVEAFWAEARVRARVVGEQSYLGRSSAGVLCPPAWSFGDSRAMADELCALVLDGTKTATSSARWAYAEEGSPLPEVGELSILCDGDGRPRALLAVTRVRVVPFDQVDAAHAAAEGEGDRTLEGWRRDHEAFFRRVDDGAHPFTPDMDVVLEELTVLHPRR